MSANHNPLIRNRQRPLWALPAREDASMTSRFPFRATAALLLACGMAAAQADDSSSPLRNGAYIAPMASGYFTDDEDGLDDGFGGTLALGYRRDYFAVEVSGTAADLSTADIEGFGVSALLFPLSSFPHAYLTVGITGLNYQDYQTSSGDLIDFNVNHLDGGLGFLWPLSWGRYDYGIRTEVRYRVGRRERDFNDLDIDLDAPKSPNHVMVNLGLQLPTRLNPPPPPPAPDPEPATVPVRDADRDGVPDDRDQCPGTPRGTEVDAQGCPIPPKLCQAADADKGEDLSLAGCEPGDVLTLRGVNFHFDSARLDPNARTLLNDVAEELARYPKIQIELSGHTDSRGSDAYNQTLSERRAESVRAYVNEQGVDSGRMTAVGFGESKPVADNDTDEGRELNRRVELRVTVGNGG